MRLLNKKAIGIPSLFAASVLAVFCILFAIFTIFLPVMSDYYVMTTFSTHHLRYDIVSARIFNAPECLAYEDKVTWSEVHAGVVDVSKFKKSQLSDCLSSSSKFRDTKYHINFIKDISNPEDDIVTNVDNGITKDNEDEFTTFSFLVNYIDKGESYPEDIQTGIMEVSLRI